jgi:hypothetical protein
VAQATGKKVQLLLSGFVAGALLRPLRRGNSSVTFAHLVPTSHFIVDH